MSVRTRLWFLALAILLVTPHPPVASLTLSPTPLEVLITDADLVVRGHIVASTAEHTPGQVRAVRTRYTLVVWEHLRAPAPTYGDDWALETAIEFHIPGGTLGRWTTRVPGVTHVAVGQEVVLLLSDTPWGLQPLGYPMGIFTVSQSGQLRPHWPHHILPEMHKGDGGQLLEGMLR